MAPIDASRDDPSEPAHAGPLHVCLVCGYSLNGMPREALCPECANPVARSLRGNMLEYADRRYVMSLLHGATIVVIALGLATVLMVAMPMSITFRSGSPAFWVRGGSLLEHLADFVAAGQSSHPRSPTPSSRSLRASCRSIPARHGRRSSSPRSSCDRPPAV
ncbi:MAG: hypothetical protein SGJ11_16070 [Phycisphaerae bacterium]|nr:hypothetical protein [Phycisphaerae bacterium]